jgi:hypothetical protein
MNDSQKNSGLVPNLPQTRTGESSSGPDTGGMSKPESAFGFEPQLPKPWYRSWTLWFNLLALGFTAAEAAVPVLRPVLGERLYAITLAIVIVGNLILRAKTVQGIVFRQPQ